MTNRASDNIRNSVTRHPAFESTWCSSWFHIATAQSGPSGGKKERTRTCTYVTHFKVKHRISTPFLDRTVNYVAKSVHHRSGQYGMAYLVEQKATVAAAKCMGKPDQDV